MRIEALRPLHLRRPAGDLHLKPGQPIELPEDEALRLLAKAPGKVRVVPAGDAIVEPAMKPDGSPLSPVYWERFAGIVGPGQPTFFARIGTGNQDKDFWVIVEFEGQTVWVRSDRLRSRQAFEQQVPLRPMEPI